MTREQRQTRLPSKLRDDAPSSMYNHTFFMHQMFLCYTHNNTAASIKKRKPRSVNKIKFQKQEKKEAIRKEKEAIRKGKEEERNKQKEIRQAEKELQQAEKEKQKELRQVEKEKQRELREAEKEKQREQKKAEKAAKEKELKKQNAERIRAYDEKVITPPTVDLYMGMLVGMFVALILIFNSDPEPLNWQQLHAVCISNVFYMI